MRDRRPFMKRLIIIFSILILGLQAYGAYESIGGTARSKAFGEALFGDMDGVNSVGYNPATISLLRDIQVYGAWDTPYTGFNDGSGINAINVDIVMPFWNSISAEPYVTRRAAIGLSIHRNSLSLVSGDSSTEIYHEGIYSFTYAKDLNDVISRGAKISAGVRFNIFDIGYSSGADIAVNPLLSSANLQKLGFGLDVGVTYDFSESIRLGLSMKNLISPNLAVLEGSTNKLISEMRFGANWDIGKLLFMKSAKLGFGIVSYGREGNDNRAADMSYNLGYEFGILSAQDLKTKPFKGEIFTFRLGAIYQSKKTQADVINLTGGLGFMYILGQKHKFNLDYAIEYGINSAIMQHTAGLTYSLMLPNSAFVYDQKEYNQAVKQEIEASQEVALEKTYQPQFPEKFAQYDEALSNVVKIYNGLSKASTEVANFPGTISILLDPEATRSTNAEQALNEFNDKLRAGGAIIKVKVVVGSTVSYKLNLRTQNKLTDEVKQAVDDFEKILASLPETAEFFRQSGLESNSLSQKIEELKKSAPADFTGKDKRYLKKASKDLETAGIELETLSDSASKQAKEVDDLMELIIKVIGKIK